MPDLTAETYANVSTIIGALSMVVVALIMLSGLIELISSIVIRPRDDE